MQGRSAVCATQTARVRDAPSHRCLQSTRFTRPGSSWSPRDVYWNIKGLSHSSSFLGGLQLLAGLYAGLRIYPKLAGWQAETIRGFWGETVVISSGGAW